MKTDGLSRVTFGAGDAGPSEIRAAVAALSSRSRGKSAIGFFA